MTMQISDRFGAKGPEGEVCDVGPPRFDEQRFLRMLGLAPSPDPVHIITAAQVQLRRWRRSSERRAGGPADGIPERVREITTARDMLLRRAFGATIGRAAD